MSESYLNVCTQASSTHSLGCFRTLFDLYQVAFSYKLIKHINIHIKELTKCIIEANNHKILLGSSTKKNGIRLQANFSATVFINNRQTQS